jgi:hypothetical protein
VKLGLWIGDQIYCPKQPKRKVAPVASREDKAMSHLPLVVSSEDDDKEV